MAIREVKKNKYRIEVVIGYNGDKKIRHYETFEGTKKEAVLRENKIKMDIKNNTFVKKNSITMQELINEFHKFNEGRIAIKTMRTYKLYGNNIIERIGHIKIKDINTKILDDLYTDLKNNTNFAEKTISHHQTLVNTILNKAVAWGYLPSNPNSRCEKIKVRKKEMKVYTPKQVDELLTAVGKECLKYQALILLAIDTGMRRGEITGLEWEDINFTEGYVEINKTTQYVSEVGIYEKSTKSESSDRRIYITDTTKRVLQKYKMEQNELKFKLGNQWKDSKKVFTTNDGANMHPNTPSRILSNIIKKNNLEYINFHGLRHTSISLMIASGVQTQIISKRAGHSNISITHNVYSHFFENGFKESANQMNKYLTAIKEA